MPAFPHRTLEHRIDTYRAAVAYHGSVRKAAAALGVSKSALHRWTAGQVNIHSPRTTAFIEKKVAPVIRGMNKEDRQTLRRATVLVAHRPARIAEWKLKREQGRQAAIDDDIEAWADVADQWVEDEFGYG